MLHLTTFIRLPGPGNKRLYGEINLPLSCSRGLVLFVHGSGSSRTSPRNILVAQALQRREFGTCLFDLLDVAEAQEDDSTAQLRFDIPLLRDRVVAAIRHLREIPNTRHLPIALYGASTGAAAALVG
jgi:putative phosphoribosyl transferase